MTSLMDLMAPIPACMPRPIWRDGAAVPGSDAGVVEHHDGDLRWMTTDKAGNGKWHKWSAKQARWMMVDPQNRLGINHLADTPPRGDQGMAYVRRGLCA